MENALRKIQTEVRKRLANPAISRRLQLVELDAEISDLLEKFRDADFDRKKLYYRVAVVLILVELAGLIE